jgi:hypothetical protein
MKMNSCQNMDLFLSKYHEKYPFIFKHDGHHQIQYEPGESRSNMFEGTQTGVVLFGCH